MRTYLPQINRACLCAFVLSGVLLGCSDAATTPESAYDAALPSQDAAPTPDACMCRAAPVADRISFDTYSAKFYGGAGLLSGCFSKADGKASGRGELLGGGCVLEDGPNAYRARFTEFGPNWNDIFPPNGIPQRDYIAWGASWEATEHDDDRRIIATASCLLPAEEDVACQRDLWVSYEVKTTSLPPQSLPKLQVSCPEGILVGGGCPVKFVPVPLDTRVLRAGFSPKHRNAWECSWANKDDTVQTKGMSIAFCLHETPLPAECGCCPSLADSIVVKQKIAPLRFGENRIEVRCDEGQFLMIGNCTIDVDDMTTIADVTMFRSGSPPTPEHPDGDYDVWGCSWFNPTGMTPPAIATALCLPAQ